MTKRKIRASAGPSPYLVDVLSAISDINQLAQLLEREPMGAKTLIALVDHVRSNDRRQHQKFAADKKHEKSREARTFVIGLWHKARCKYRYNKDFSEAAAQAVLKKFNVSVKAETIARDWLRGVGDSQSMAVKKNAIAYVDGGYFDGKP